MAGFECKRTQECGDLCHLLQSQGLETASEDGNCASPDFFVERDGSVVAELEQQPNDPELTAFALASLHNVLARPNDEPRNLDHLIEVQFNVLGAYRTMWQAIIDATKNGRKFTSAEVKFYQQKIDDAIAQQEEAFTEMSHETRVQARAAFDNQTLRDHDIVFNDQALRVINTDIGNYIDGKHTLIVGDMGIAKTNLVLFTSDMANGDYGRILIAGKGDKMSDELMGRKEYDADARAYPFVDSSFLVAIQEGYKVVIDEANGVDPKILMRMHQPLLTKPGETVVVDEDNHRKVTLKEGFHVAATANEISSNYKDRNRLDPAFRDRFDVVPVYFPDHENQNPLLEIPTESLRLAFAAVSDERGVMSPHINPDDLVQFVRLAHITQHLYSKVLTESVRSALSEGQGITTTGYTALDKPVMTNCISPRTMIKTLQRCADGNKPGLNLHDKIDEIIEALDQGGANTNATWARKALRFLTPVEGES